MSRDNYHRFNRTIYVIDYQADRRCYLHSTLSAERRANQSFAARLHRSWCIGDTIKVLTFASAGNTVRTSDWNTRAWKTRARIAHRFSALNVISRAELLVDAFHSAKRAA